MKKRFAIYFLSLLGFIPLAIWCYRYIDYDLWYDEVYSLENFALTDFNSTFLYYPAPNNHIFFNFTTQLISRLLGFRDIFSVESNVYFFRGFQLVISIITAFISVLLVRKFFNIKSSYLVFIILFSTIPFMNFSLQLRGYNMSGLFLIMLVYNMLDYLEYKKIRSLFILLFSATFLLYTIPSNLYALLGSGLSIFVVWFYFKKNGVDIPASNYRNVLIFIAFGTLLASLLYFPIWRDVIFNRYSNSTAPGMFYSVRVMAEVLWTFFSKRYMLLLLILPGAFLFLKTADTKEKGFFLFILVGFIAPFVISFFHQKSPFSRVFVPLAPIFVILVTLLISRILDTKFSHRISTILQATIIAYCTFVFVIETNNNDMLIAKKMTEENKLSQDLYRNFYLAEFYRQEDVIEKLKLIYKGLPVIKYQQEDDPSTDLYLRKYNIDFCEIYTIEELKPFLMRNEPIYILTSYKNKVMAEFVATDTITVSDVISENTFTIILKVSND